MVIVTVIVKGYMGAAPLADAQPDVLVQVTRASFIVFTVICAAGVLMSLKRNHQ